MHPDLMLGLLPDSRQVSREAARRHAILARRKRGRDVRRLELRAWRPATRRRQASR